MEIDSLEDLDQEPVCFVPKISIWNGHQVEQLVNLKTDLHQHIHPMTGPRTLLGRVVTHFSRPIAENFESEGPHIRLVSAITSPITLRQLLSPDYLNQQTLQIPFTLPPDVVNLPPFVVVPEGFDLDVFNISPLPIEPPSFQYTIESQFVNEYLTAEYAKIISPKIEEIKAEILAAAQASAMKHLLAELSATEQARASAAALAHTKIQTASTERDKAIYLATRAQFESSPPPVPSFPKEPYDVTYRKWLAERKSVHAAVVEQINKANFAIEEAKAAGASLAAQTQALISMQTYVSSLSAASQQIGFYPKLGLEILCGKEYVSNLYQQFGLQDPFSDIAIDLGGETSHASRLLESLRFPDLSDYANDPSYPKFTLRIEDSIDVCQTNDKDLSVLQSIESYFSDREVRKPIVPSDKYASTFADSKPDGPFGPVPLLGYPDQSTVHYHCGISNSLSSVVEGGLCLNASLDKRFAIQPHLVHSNNIASGLLYVFFENIKSEIDNLQSAGVTLLSQPELPQFILERSNIQKAIEYEVGHLSEIAKIIISKNNPNLKQVHVTFSNSGYLMRESLKLLPPEYRDTIVVITTGSTAIIENDLAHKVYNMIGSKDWPSKICNGGMKSIEAAKMNGAIIDIITQTDTQTGIGGHYFIQREYQERVSEYIEKEVCPVYEIY